jgi:hypothetical protein
MTYIILFLIAALVISSSSSTILVIKQVNAQQVISQIPLLPLTDPQRNNPAPDNLTQTIIADEDKIMKVAYRIQAQGNNTIGYKALVTANNVMVCLNAVHNNDETLLGTCDGFMSRTQGEINAGNLGHPPKFMIQALHDYLVIRGILPHGGTTP